MKKFDGDKFYTLLAIAYAVAKDLEEGDERVEYYLHLAMEGYREFSFDHSHEVVSVEVPMKAWKQIDMPCGMVDWVRVGFKCGNLIKLMTQDDYIPKTFTRINNIPQENQQCPDISSVETVGDLIPLYNDPYQTTAKYYGQMSRWNYLGYFAVDWKNRVINFKETVAGQDTVYLEYVTDGLEASAMTVVNPYAYQVLKSWVKWQRKENSDRYGLGEKQAAERAYNRDVFKFQTRITHIELEDIKEALRGGYTMVPHN